MAAVSDGLVSDAFQFDELVVTAVLQSAAGLEDIRKSHACSGDAKPRGGIALIGVAAAV